MSADDTPIFGADEELRPDLLRVDWEATPLGPPAEWPQSLRTIVDTLLSSRFSMWMAWGPELTFFCNAAYRHATLGRKYPWALGRPAREVWAEIWDDVIPRIEQVLSTGRATWDSTLQLFLERSGYLEESYHTFSYSPLRDEAGHVAGMLCVVSEDTEQVIAERRMSTLRDLGSDLSVVRTEEQMLAFATLQLSRNRRDLPFALVYLFGDDGDVRLAGASGIEPDHPAVPALLAAAAPTVWSLGEGPRTESTVISLDADLRAVLPTGDWPEPPVQVLAMPLFQQGAAPYGFLVAGLNRYRLLDEAYRGFVQLVAAHLSAGIGSVRSYQAQQRRAEELAELDRAKTTFFSNVSHELRTPLTLILGPVAELLARARGRDEQARQELEVVQRNGLRLTKLVNTLLDFSRIEAGRMQAHYEPVDLAAATADLASVFRSAVDRAGLVLTVDCPPLDEPVHIDREMWEKVVLNLLSNALKFTFEGSIDVRVRRDDTDAVVTVSDTGIGVPASEMPRLFERFQRIETPYARSSEGSGIGLALVKELVGLHGGSITADSTEGVGTTFTIRLPLGVAHLPTDAVPPTEATRGGAGIAEPYVREALRWVATERDTTTIGGVPGTTDIELASVGSSQVWTAGPPPRVLIADDNIDMREYLSRLLRAAGYVVDVVSDGAHALASIRADPPDLVVSDVMMPRLDGLALVKALRADSRTVAVPVLLLSARAGQEASIEGLHVGADDYLVKPFVAAELLARVRANVELARLRYHHARWRSALVASMQEAFFVCDEDGAVIEINSAFTHVLGYSQDGLPYRPVHPWWPDPATDPDSYQQCGELFAALRAETRGTYIVPAVHRDGHRLWIRTAVDHVRDPDTGRRVVVGTFSDATAEHYTVQRQSALAELNEQLAQADTVDDGLHAAVEGLRRLWRARRVIAATFIAATVDSSPVWSEPSLVCEGDPAGWTDLPDATRRAIGALRDGQMLSTDTSQPGTAGIALHHPRGVLVIWIELAERRPFTVDDQMLLTMLAGRLGQGLQRIHQIDQQRETALALQHAMLGPAVLPEGFAVRYQPAARPLQIGGDWYDVVDLGDGRLALIVGDCVGHGLAAATIMGQLRSACRALLLENPRPAAALEALDRFAAQLPGARCTTAFCAVLSSETGELVYSSAGHPPPILVQGDRSVRMLDDGRSIPLGLRLRSEWPRPEARVIVPPRSTLLLYTDGLVERRRVALDQGIDRAAEIVRDGGSSALDDLASQLMSRLAPSGGYQDDVAVLLYRQPPPLTVNLDADVQHLAPARAALRSWLNRAGVKPDQALSVLTAAGEAIANAIEHGHRHIPGTVTLHATALADQLHLIVTDNGRWRTPQPAADSHRGRGIALMRGLMHDVTIQPGATGTTVELRARIH